MTARRSEHQEQAVLVGLLRNFYPDVLFFAIPNGGLRNVKVAVKLKAEGVLPGVPDLLVAEPRGSFHGLFVEMKAIGGTTSKDQKKVKLALEARGYAVTVAKGSQQAFHVVETYLGLSDPVAYEKSALGE